MGTNATYQYWDFMEGDAMVCSSIGPLEYRAMCNFNQYGIGFSFICEGVWFLYNAMKLGKILSSVVPAKVNAPVQEKIRTGNNRAHMLYFKSFTYVLGFEFLGFGLVHLIGGNGTIHSSSTNIGIFSDFITSAAVPCTLYASLLQLRGAEAFRNLIRLANYSGGDMSKQSWIAGVLDIVQSVGAFPITLGFWILLASAVLKRSEFYTAFNTLFCCVGIRSLFENIFDRMRTIARVDELQQGAQGTLETKRRRRNILRKKVRALIFHTLVVLANIFLPLSVILFSSVNSSTQMLVHNGANYTIIAAMMWVVCIGTHKQVNKNYERQNALVRTGKNSEIGKIDNPFEYTVADESGLSAIGQSEVATGWQQTRNKRSGSGLFSDKDVMCN